MSTLSPRRNRAEHGAAIDARRARFERVVSMYAQALCAGRIRAEFEGPLNTQLTSLAGYVGISFAELLERERQRCTSQSREASAKPAAASAGELPRLGRNVSLRGLPPVKMSRTARLDANRRAMEVLAAKPSRAGYTDAQLDALRLYTGNGGLQVDDAGVLNQHYTSYSVARFVWDKLRAMGAPNGWYLEPGCGAGNFIGLKPSRDIGVIGFDYDPVAVAVASALYPDDEIILADAKDFPWERYRSFAVGAVGNVPFGNYSRYKRGDRFEKLRPLIHDGLILHALDTIRPGGVAALITSAGTMDKRNSRVRRAMVEMAHFVGAYRLPDSSFRDNASTTVTTDILFFQKRSSPADEASFSALDEAFIESVAVDADFSEAAAQEDDGVRLNRYYLLYPEHVLGRLEAGRGQFRTQTGVVGPLTQDMLDRLIKAQDMRWPEPVAAPVPMPEGASTKASAKLTPERASAEALLASIKGVIERQREGASEAERAASRKALRDAATAHVKAFGVPGKSRALAETYGGTSDWYTLRALVQTKGKELVFSDIATRDTLFSATFAPRPASKRLADVALYLTQVGREATVDALAAESGRGVEEVQEAVLSGSEGVFLNPATDRVEIGPLYLSGYLPDKIASAEAAGLEANVNALRGVLPKRLEASEIEFDLLDVNTYLPADIGAAYVNYAVGGKLVGIKRNWSIINANPSESRAAGWGWQRDYAQIMEWYLNGEGYRKQPAPQDDVEAQARTREEKSANENKMRRIIPQRFSQWLRDAADEDMRERAVTAWNDAYNSTTEPQWTGDTFALAEIGETWTNGLPFEPRLHQKRFVERALYTGGFINAHGVGAGKTLSAIMLAGALRQRGLARKPLFVVPGKVLEKWIAEYLACFPAARVLNLRTDKARREQSLSLLQQNEYDAIFVTHEGFRSIPASPKLMKDYFDVRLGFIRQEIQKLSEQIKEREAVAAKEVAAAAIEKKKVKARLSGPAKRLKDLYLSLMRAEQKIEKSLSGTKDNAVFWDELGVDAVFVDEAHNFKNYFLSDLAVELGIGVPESSDRAEEAMMKLFDVNRKSVARGEGERGVYLLTATPTNNSPLEALTFLQMVAPSYLRSIGIEHPDDFIRQFARIENVLTLDLMGNAKEKNVVVGYKALDVLRRIFGRFVEFLDVDALNAMRREEARVKGEDPATVRGLVVRPALKARPVYMQPGPRDSLIRLDLEGRVVKIRNRDPYKLPGPNGGLDNYLSVSMTGSRGAVDPNFYWPVSFVSDGLHSRTIQMESKAGAMCEAVKNAYWTAPRTVYDVSGVETKDALNGQLIFCDPITTTEPAGGWNFHRAIRDRLVSLGIPAREIAIVNGQENAAPEKKKAVQDAFNSGSLRVVIGNTAAMGEGMDLNRWCTDIHHLDVPWKPSELTQRNGRGHRQGNANGEVTVHYYLMKRSMDVYRYQLLVKKQRWIDELWNGRDNEAEGESDTGLDYETVMMSLQDDPERIKALDLSRQAKRLRGIYENARDDRSSAEIALEKAELQWRHVQAELVTLNDLRMVEAVSLPDGRIAEWVTGASPRWRSAGYVTYYGEQYIVTLPAYALYATATDGTERLVGRLGISRDRHYSGFYYATWMPNGLPERRYAGEDRDLSNLHAKVMGVLRRFVESYPAERAKRFSQIERQEVQVKVARARLADALDDVTQARAEYDALAKDILAFAEQSPRASSLIDWKAVGLEPPPQVIQATVEEQQENDSWLELADSLAAVQAGPPEPRENPAPEMAYIGTVDRLTVLAPGGTVVDFEAEKPADTVLVWLPQYRRVLLVPATRARWVSPDVARRLPGARAGRAAHEVWQNHVASGRALRLDLPATALRSGLPREHALGTAETIWYRSNKRVQPGDAGQFHAYYHHFDRGRRLVHELPYPDGGVPVVVISGLSINGRGILN